MNIAAAKTKGRAKLTIMAVQKGVLNNQEMNQCNLLPPLILITTDV